MIIEIKVLTKK